MNNKLNKIKRQMDTLAEYLVDENKELNLWKGKLEIRVSELHRELKIYEDIIEGIVKNVEEVEIDSVTKTIKFRSKGGYVTNYYLGDLMYPFAKIVYERKKEKERAEQTMRECDKSYIEK